MRDKELFFFFSGVEDRLWKTDLRCLWKFPKSETALKINVDPEPDSLNRSPNSIISSALMQVVWWLKRRKKLSFENRLTVDIKDFIFTLEPEDNLFLLNFRDFPQSTSYLSLSAPGLLFFNENVRWTCRSNTWMLQLYFYWRLVSMRYWLYPAEKSKHFWFEFFFFFLIISLI